MKSTANTGSLICKMHGGQWLLVGSMLWCASVNAGVNICSSDFNGLHSQAFFSKTGNASINNFPGDVSQQRVGLDLVGPLPASETRTSYFGAGHRYTIFDIDGVATQTNGHVHTFYLPYFHAQQADRGVMHFSVAPAISASSNIIKTRNNWRHETFQLLGGFRFISENNWYAGGCADYRFGEFKIYPVLGWRFDATERWQLDLGLPDSTARYRVHDTMQLNIALGPDGNEWEVADEMAISRLQFGYQAYLLAFFLDWQPSRRMSVSFGVARRFAQKLELILFNGQRVQLDVADSNEFSLQLRWVFGKLKK